MRKLFSAVVLFSLAYGGDIRVVEGEGYHYLPVSLTDVNRVVCPTEVEGVVYSKEKAFQATRKGKNVWVKILPKVKPDGSVEYPSYPRELYVVCGGKTFSLVLLPKKKPPTTIVLNVPFRDEERASFYERSLKEYERLISDLIRHAYRESIPPGYEVKRAKGEGKEFKEVSMVLRKRYVGSRYEVEEYVLTAKEKVQLHEGAFIPYLSKPLAIAIVKPALAKGESTRMFVVKEREK